MFKILCTFTMITLLCFSFFTCSPPNTKLTYEGDVSEAKIKRDKVTKETILDINVQGKWCLFAGSSPDHIDFSKPFLTGEGSGIFKLDIPMDKRIYFSIETTKGRGLLTETLLPMKGGYNFRDLGGIKTVDGKHVKWGKLFRTDDLQNLTSDDLLYLSTIPILSIVDFRSAEEVEAAPDKHPGSLIHTFSLPINPGNLRDFVNLPLDKSVAFSVDSFMIQMNQSFVSDSSCIEIYKKFFSILQQNENIPLLFHCSAGKDRTGYAAAMILYALGVDESTIIENYLASNVYLGDKYKSLMEKNPELEPLLKVKQEYLQASFQEIKNSYGTIENYLKEVLQVDIPKMRTSFLD